MQEKANTNCNVFTNTDPGFGTPDFTPLPDSTHYIQKLENRLSKVKGTNKELTSKDMIRVMQTAREDIMSRLIASSSNQRLFSDDDGEREVSASYIERKLFPEKIGVTYEEIQHLLECDILEKTVEEKNSDSSSDNSVDR